MSKQNTLIRKVAIVLFFVLIATLISVISNQKTKPLNNPSKTISSSTENANSINLPFPINKPYLGMVILVYNFFGNIKEIKNVSEGMQVILDIPNDNLPSFIVNTQYTQIFKPGTDGKLTPASTDDLKVGTKANVQIMYDLKLNTWRVIRVDIF